MSWTRGARPRGNLLYGQTWLETPDPVRSPKLSNHGRVQYSGGGPPGKRTYCTVPHHISVLPTSEVRTSESPGGRAEDLAKNLASPSLLCKGSSVESVFCLGDLAARRRSRRSPHLDLVEDSNQGWQWFCLSSRFDSCAAFLSLLSLLSQHKLADSALCVYVAVLLITYSL